MEERSLIVHADVSHFYSARPNSKRNDPDKRSRTHGSVYKAHLLCPLHRREKLIVLTNNKLSELLYSFESISFISHLTIKPIVILQCTCHHPGIRIKLKL